MSKHFTPHQRDFAMELESNVKSITECYRNLLNGTRVGNSPNTSVDGLTLLAQANQLVVGVESLFKMITELKLAILTNSRNNIDLVKNIEAQRSKGTESLQDMSSTRRRVQYEIQHSIRLLEMELSKPPL